MKLYFQQGKNHRIAIDTWAQVYSTNDLTLGGYNHYIKITKNEYNDLLEQINNKHFTKVEYI